MKKKFKIGTTQNGTVTTSEDSLNSNVFSVGKPGSGKTTAMMKILIRQAMEGGTCIAFNWHQCLTRENWLPEVREAYEKYVEVIDLAKGGIELPLFEKLVDASGNDESDINVIQRVTALFKEAVNLTDEQEQYLYNCIKEIYRDEMIEEKNTATIEDWLTAQDKSIARRILSKLRIFTNGELLQNGNFMKSGSRIYEINLNELEYDTQKVVVKFLLSYFMRLANKGLFMENGLTIFVDEAANLDCNPDSTLFTMMNESRKLGLQVLLAFPSLFAGKKKNMEVVTQCGTHLYFNVPDKDRREVAKLIDSKKADAYMYTLSCLKKGQCIVTGNLEVEGREIAKPILVHI